MRSLLFSLFFFALTNYYPSSLQAQTTQKESLSFHFLDQTSVKNLEITRERTFESSGLYGFMNGGAELFLEYGFLQLLEQRFTYQKIPFIAEYYFMDSPQNAYGIYSIHTFKCRRADERFLTECLTPGLLQLYHGQLYICLKCLDRTIDTQPLLDSLAEFILNNNPVTKDDNNLYQNVLSTSHSGTLYYVCGDLGLSSAHIEWATFFAPYSHYSMWLRINQQTKEVSAQIQFDSIDDMESFCEKNKNQFSYTVIPPSTLKVCPLM